HLAGWDVEHRTVLRALHDVLVDIAFRKRGFLVGTGVGDRVEVAVDVEHGDGLRVVLDSQGHPRLQVFGLADADLRHRRHSSSASSSSTAVSSDARISGTCTRSMTSWKKPFTKTFCAASSSRPRLCR